MFVVCECDEHIDCLHAGLWKLEAQVYCGNIPTDRGGADQIYTYYIPTKFLGNLAQGARSREKLQEARATGHLSEVRAYRPGSNYPKSEANEVSQGNVKTPGG